MTFVLYHTLLNEHDFPHVRINSPHCSKTSKIYRVHGSSMNQNIQTLRLSQINSLTFCGQKCKNVCTSTEQEATDQIRHICMWLLRL